MGRTKKRLATVPSASRATPATSPGDDVGLFDTFAWDPLFFLYRFLFNSPKLTVKNPVALPLPNLKLRMALPGKPAWYLIFVLILISYFLAVGGIVYDIIVEPPSIGSVRDPRTGEAKPQTVMAGRINGQYIIEGISASFMLCLGGIGFIVLDKANETEEGSIAQNLLVGAGFVMVILAYGVSHMFIRLKVPGYMM